MIRFIDLFAGIGGFRLGLERANSTNNQGRASQYSRCSFHCIWSCEIDKYCEVIYKKNFGEGFNAHDVRAVEPATIPDFDLLCSGFPCQSFSIAGKRRGFEDTRGTLFFEICRIARAKRPQILLLENVKGLLSHDEGRTFQAILESLDELGYDCEWEVLNSKNFGVPQNRERVFIVGHSRNQPRCQVFPIGEDGGISETNGREMLPSLTGTDYKGPSKQRAGLIVTHPCLTPDRKQKRQHGRRFKQDGEPMFTLTGQDVHGVLEIANAVDCDGYLRAGARPRDAEGKPQLLPIGYRRLRRLTPLECERLQGFPDNWTEGVSDTQRYRMLGNAVTVNVIEAIGERILEALSERA